MNSLSWKCLAVLALALVVAGCSDGGPRLYKAGGTVTYKNAPVEGAQVTFAYDDGNFANGTTDAAGKFQLTYMGKPGGAALGKCKVSVSKVVAPKVASAPSNDKPKTKEEWEAKKKMMEGGGAMRTTIDDSKAAAAAAPSIPRKYADGTSSGLVFEIKANEKENDFPIELKD
jgi:hypothetical protein